MTVAMISELAIGMGAHEFKCLGLARGQHLAGALLSLAEPFGVRPLKNFQIHLTGA
jgi:hypothetical protein